MNVGGGGGGGGSFCYQFTGWQKHIFFELPKRSRKASGQAKTKKKKKKITKKIKNKNPPGASGYFPSAIRCFPNLPNKLFDHHMFSVCEVIGFCRLTWQRVDMWEEFRNVYVLMTWVDCPEVTLCDWKDIKIQLLLLLLLLLLHATQCCDHWLRGWVGEGGSCCVLYWYECIWCFLSFLKACVDA